MKSKVFWVSVIP
ncbi:hypothetical protein NAA24_04030, partial [Listeria monocytogenes]|nr:hypothetical protein [Listeria monocytogenes]